MLDRVRSALSTGIVIGGFMAGAALLPVRIASGQARGTLQVTASVVPTQASFGALSLASQALGDWVRDARSVARDASTVAQVRIAYEPRSQGEGDVTRPESRDLVVHIDFLKN